MVADVADREGPSFRLSAEIAQAYRASACIRHGSLRLARSFGMRLFDYETLMAEVDKD